MTTQVHCPLCGNARPGDVADAPSFHKPGCKARRKLQAAERKSITLGDFKEPETRIIRGVVCKLDDRGLILAAIDPDGLRWKSGLT